MIYKNAFIPYAPFKIKDKEEYYSDDGKHKRTANELLSVISGAGVGLAAGGALGLLAGKAKGRYTPGRFGMRPSQGFADLDRQTGTKMFSHIAKKYSDRGTKIPASIHMPIGGMILGSAYGMFPAEYKARRKMERSVGIPETTSREYARTDVIPLISGTIAGMTAASGVDSAMRGVPGRGIVSFGGGLGLGIMVERYIREAMERKNKQEREA